MTVITASACRAYRTCARKYRYAYVDLLRPRHEPEALRLGTIVHAGLEAHWLRRDAPPIVDADPYVAARASAVLAGYDARWLPTRLAHTVLAVERAFSAPLCAGWFLAGKIDALASRDGRTILVEHKTASADLSPGSDYWARLAIDSQISIYYVGAASQGYQIDECCYDVLRKPSIKPCRVPTLDAAGLKIVRDASGARVLTARGAPRQTADAASGHVLESRDETPGEYRLRCLATIAAAPESYYARASVVRLPGEVDECVAELIETTRQIDACLASGVWPRSDSQCYAYGSQCAYFPLCAHCGSESDYARGVSAHPELPEVDNALL